MREVGQGALGGFLAFPPTLAEEDGRRGVAIRGSLDVHGINMQIPYPTSQKQYIIYTGTCVICAPP
jgi:hypothetical protein